MPDLLPENKFDRWLSDVAINIDKRAGLYSAAEKSVSLQKQLLLRCRDDINFYTKWFVWQYDTRIPPYDLPFLPFGRQPLLLREFSGRHYAPPKGVAGLSYKHTSTSTTVEIEERLPSLAVVKSRDAGATVCMLIAVSNDYLFHRGSHHGLITRVLPLLDDGTLDSLFGRLDYIFSHLPVWMYNPKHHRRRSHPSLYQNLLNGNLIKGQSADKGAPRGPRYRRLWVDESNFIPELPLILEAASATSDSIALLSSVKGSHTEFAKIALSKGGYKSVKIEERDSRKQGQYLRIDLHWTSDPRKDKAWEEFTRERTLPEVFAQEYDCDFTASTPDRIFTEFSPDKHVLPLSAWKTFEEDWLPECTLLEAWDFGSGDSLTCNLHGYYLEAHDLLYLAYANAWKSERVDVVAAQHAQAGWRTAANPNGTMPHIRVGDIAGKHRESTQESWMSNLSDLGVKLRGIRIYEQEELLQLIRLKFLQGRILVAPRLREPCRANLTLPSLVECLTEYKRRGSKGKAERSPDHDKPEKNIHSHLADCFTMICQEVWGHTSGKIISQTRDAPAKSLLGRERLRERTLFEA